MKKQSDTVLWEAKPAGKWVEAYPIGNGTIGAMCFGGIAEERYALNHEELWSGHPRDNIAHADHSALVQAKELVRAGKYQEADALIQRDFTGYATNAYLPVGNLHLKTYLPEGEISDYSRALSLEEAVHTVSFKAGGVTFMREDFVSAPAGAMVIRLTADRAGALSFDLTFDSLLRSFSSLEGDTLALDGEAYQHSEQNRRWYSEFKSYYEEGERGIRYRAAVRVVDTDGRLETADGGMKPMLGVRDASYATVMLGIATDFAGYDKMPGASGKDYRAEAAAPLQAAAFSSLRALHVEDYRRFYARTDFAPDGVVEDAPPTGGRLVAFAEGKEDPTLYALYFNFGKYLLISSAREGTQPGNLQGIWSEYLTPPWNSNYTLNINTEMNDWATLPLGLFEIQMPLVRLIEEISVTGRETASRLYHAPGFVCHHNTDLWRLTVPVPGLPLWSFWGMSGGWLCRHLYDRYLYTRDIDFLRDRALPVMREAARFYLSQLEEDKDGYLIYFPSTSPESDYRMNDTGETAIISETSTMTMAIVRELFGNILAASEVLGERDALTEEIAAALPRLLPYRTEEASGCLREWYTDSQACDVHHRHISALYPLHPGHDITPDKTPELARAARLLLERRGDKGTGWSVAWKINFWARLWDGDRAKAVLDLQLEPGDDATKKGGTYPNLFDAHPPFQIDGNFGAVSGIIEMLVQSREGEVLLLPALSEKFPAGKLSGIRLIGGGSISLAWREGKLLSYSLQMPEGVPAPAVFCAGERLN